jgi:hypothetical protein
MISALGCGVNKKKGCGMHLKVNGNFAVNKAYFLKLNMSPVLMSQT